MMKFAVFTLLLLNLSVASAADLFALNPESGALISVVHAKDLLRQCSRPAPVGVTNVWQPTPAQIRELEARLPAALTAAWPDHMKADLNASSNYDRNFARQYAGYVAPGRRFIYVNAFPLDIVDFDGANLSPAAKVDWHENAILICDGGDRFWGVEYDPYTKTFSHFAFNGAI